MVIGIREQLENDYPPDLEKLRKEVEMFQDEGDTKAMENKSSTDYQL